MLLTEESLVLYTDGGCILNAGIGGWGIHGYFFNTEVPKQGAGCSKGIPTSIGYCNKENNKGIAMPPCTLFTYVDGFGGILKDATNNIAELTAMIEGLKLIIEKKPKQALVYSDSKYVIQGLTEWVTTWVRNDWVKQDGTFVANKEYWQTLISLKDIISEMGIALQLEWIKGHAGEVGNEMADTLATWGLILAKKKVDYFEVKISEAKGYWSKTYKYNRIIDKPRWYFNSYNTAHWNEAMGRNPNGDYVYYLGDHGPDDEMLGKAVADNSFAVVFLKDKIEELELVRNYQNLLNIKNYESLVIGKLDKILGADNLEIINNYNSLLFESLPHEKNIHLNKALLTKEMNPPQLGYRAINSLNELEAILNSFLTDPEKDRIKVTDITDIFYGTEPKGKSVVTKLKASIGSSTKKINVKCLFDTINKVGETDIPLLIGIDTPSRNALAALAEESPRIYVVTWRESDTAFRYATVFKTNDDIGIWAGVYSNLRMLTP